MHGKPRHLTLLCRIVDNLGDAGVALRLARHWLAAHPCDSITLCTDQLQPFVRLLGQPGTTDSRSLAPLPQLRLIETLDPPAGFDWGDVVIELFGTPLPSHWKQTLAQRPQRPLWINLEYLSAESWVSSCHGLTSIDPASGWRQHFFFPGFDEATGGLLGPEPVSVAQQNWAADALVLADGQTHTGGQTHTDGQTHATQQTHTGEQRQASSPGCHTKPSAAIDAFVFAYSLAPLHAWLSERQLQAPEALKTEQTDITFHVASASNAWLTHASVKPVAFVPQTQFDALLGNFDLLFVRGEDSFVRAQLTGKPFVWQIYPTDDGEHWNKLAAFFERYARGLNPPARDALKNLWWYWNGDKALMAHGADILASALKHWPELQSNARDWQARILSQCTLIEKLSALVDREAPVISGEDANP